MVARRPIASGDPSAPRSHNPVRAAVGHRLQLAPARDFEGNRRASFLADVGHAQVCMEPAGCPPHH